LIQGNSGRSANKKSRASSETRLRLCEIYSLRLYRCFLAVLCTQRVGWFKIDFFEGRARARPYQNGSAQKLARITG